MGRKENLRELKDLREDVASGDPSGLALSCDDCDIALAGAISPTLFAPKTLLKDLREDVASGDPSGLGSGNEQQW